MTKVPALLAPLRRVLLRTPRKANYRFVLRDWLPLFDLEASAQVLETRRFAQNLEPVRLEGPASDRLLVLAPHPDDDTIAAGGTLLRAAARGAEVHVAYLTDGDADPARARAIRDEASAVCAEMGAKATFLGCAPRAIPLDGGIPGRLAALVREVEPGAVLLPFLLDDHDDHRRASQLLLRTAPLLPRADFEVWAYQVYSTVLPNVVVDITELAERKRALVRMWRSVHGDRDWAHYALGTNAANGRYLPGARAAYAETFFVVPAAEYLDLCARYFAHPPERIYRAPAYRASSAPGP